MPRSGQLAERTDFHAGDIQNLEVDRLIEGVPKRLATSVSRTGALLSRSKLLLRDKWILSSATQKLIRRGQAEEAVRAALALHKIDAEYLPRRLPTVALEDVGIGNLGVCFDTLHLLGRQRFPTKASEADQRLILTNLVTRLADSIKSRAACDIVCIATTAPTFPDSKLVGASTKYLVAVATDVARPFAKRALALNLLTGMSVPDGRWTRPISRFNADALSKVAESLNLPQVLSWMMMNGRHTSGLAAMLPLVWEAVQKDAKTLQVKSVGSIDFQKHSEERIGGVPAYSADMYTALGRDAIAAFSKILRRKYPPLFARIPNLPKLVGMAIFHAEGTRLNRWLESDQLLGYRQSIERMELEELGLASHGHRSLYNVLEVEMPLLLQFRRHIVTTALQRHIEVMQLGSAEHTGSGELDFSLFSELPNEH